MSTRSSNYRYFLFGSPTSTSSWNTTHLSAFWLTIVMSIFVTILNFAICYPLAYYMAQVGDGQKVRLLMLLLIVPYWVNEILRAFALRLLFGTGGLINTVLIGLGILSVADRFPRQRHRRSMSVCPTPIC